MRYLIEGHPEIVIHNGKVLQIAMTRTKLTHRELNAAIREAGCASIDDVSSPSSRTPVRSA